MPIYIKDISVQLVSDDESPQLLIGLDNKVSMIFPTNSISYLQGKSLNDLKNCRIIGPGSGIQWPTLDIDLSLNGILKEIFELENFIIN